MAVTPITVFPCKKDSSSVPEWGQLSQSFSIVSHRGGPLLPAMMPSLYAQMGHVDRGCLQETTRFSNKCKRF